LSKLSLMFQRPHFQILVGPEALWLLYYLVATLMVKTKGSQTKTKAYIIQTCWFWIPLLSLFSFSLWWFPSVEKEWLLLRVWLAGLLGGHFTLEKIMNASPTQNSGTGMGYLAGMIFLIFFLICGSLVISISFCH